MAGKIGIFFLRLIAFGSVATSYCNASNPPSFGQDVLPILEKHCLRCHRDGGIAADKNFTSYADIRPWAKAIKQAVASREMPPWSADPAKSLKFRNDARLSEGDKSTLIAWVNAGAPLGDGVSKPKLSVEDKWIHPSGRKPDLVISMGREIQLPAAGDIPYLRLLVKLPMTEDRWVEACQARPGNPAVVHHMAVTEVGLDEGVSSSDVEGFALLAKQMGQSSNLNAFRPVVASPAARDAYDMLAIYTPGAALERYPEGVGKLLKSGANRYLDFNLHYTTTGRVETDRSQVAFWFLPAAPRRSLYRIAQAGETILVNGRELLTDAPGEKAEGTHVVIPPIPPGTSDYRLTSVTAYAEPITLYQLHPHAHYRARAFQYTAVFPDGREVDLLTIPKYDYRWQLAYDLETPLELPAGSKLVVTARYDNSLNNPLNPAPDHEVYFRAQNQSRDEMFSPFVQYAAERQSRVKLPIVATTGCLTQAGPSGWTLTSASKPTPIPSQTSTSESVRQASMIPAGVESFRLLGLAPFQLEQNRGQRMVVRGVLIYGSMKGVNVTSMLPVAGECARLP